MTLHPKVVVALFLAVSGGVVAAAVYTAMEAPRVFGLQFGEGCRLDVTGEAPRPAGDETTARQEGGKWVATRVLTYRLPALAEGRVLLCADTGSVALEGGSAEATVVEAKVFGYATTEAAARQAALEFQPEVRSNADGIDAWHPAGRARFAQGVGATVSFRALVPPAMLVHADLATDTGAVKVSGVRLAALQAHTDTGGIQLEPAWAAGDLAAGTDTGAVHARFPALGAATMRFSADTGGIDVMVPGDARHGYDVRADTDTGAVVVALPGLEDLDRAAKDHRHARTAGFDTREVQVRITAGTDTGSVGVGVA